MSFSRLPSPGKLTVFCAIILCAGEAHAQTSSECSPKSQVPCGPLLACASNFSQWVITFSYPEDRQKDSTAPASNPAADLLKTRVKTITTTKTDDIVHEEMVDAQGGKFDHWYVGDIQYTKTANSDTWLQNVPIKYDGRNSSYSPLPASGFRGLEWITSENYAATLKYGGRSCLVFVQHAPANLNLSNPATQIQQLQSLSTVAFIDAESHLPIQVQVDGVIRFYQFVDPPSAKQVLPPDLADQITKGNEGRARLSARAPRPF